MKNGDKCMPRPRKYDYEKDYPVKVFLTIPVDIMNILEDEMGMNRQDMSKLVERLLRKHLDKNSKKG